MRKIFLNWDKPLLDTAVKELAKFATDSPPDLSSICIVTQTSQSGKRIKSELAQYFPDGLFPPQTLTPDFLINISLQNHKIPSDLDLLYIWLHCIQYAPDKILHALKLKRTNNFDALIQLAETFCELRKELSKNFYTIATVYKKLKDLNTEEIERWQALAELEMLYLDYLQKLGFDDPEITKINAPIQTDKFKNVKKFILIGVSDPSPLALRKIEKLAKNFEIEIWIHAPIELEKFFDEWGCPIIEKWENQSIELSTEQFLIAGALANQAELVTKRFYKLVTDKKNCALVMLNPNLAQNLQKAFLDRGLIAYNPAGIPLFYTSLYSIFKNFAEFIKTKSFEDFASFARNPFFLHYLKVKEKSFSTFDFLKDLDDFYSKFLPQNIDLISEKSSSEHLKIALKNIKIFEEFFKTKPLSSAIKSFFEELFSVEIIEPQNDDCESVSKEDIAIEIKNALVELKDSALEKSELELSEKLKIFIKHLSSKKVYPSHKKNSLPLSGWLELPFEKAENLIICGMNEGYLPEPPSTDIFLPDSIREKLGLGNSRKRFARDAYQLQSILKSRSSGSIYFVIGKTDINNEPLLPSRLLFLCDSENIAKRAKKIFLEKPNTSSPPTPSTIQWKLKLEEKKIPDSLSISDLKNYISCPFRFYLKKVLKMQKFDEEKTELDALDFGTIIHEVLEKFAKGDLKNSKDSAKIKDFLFTTLDEIIKERYGNSLTLNISIQIEGMKSRLAKFAEIQAKENSNGWEIFKAEYEIKTVINGMEIKGRIDRIDRDKNGNIRILDYKTADKAINPEDAHTKGSSNALPDFCRINDGAGWVDLQLPLYIRILEQEEEFKNSHITCGYFNLPKAILDTGIKTWDDVGEYLNSAWSCAEEIVQKIRDGVFWPPADKVHYDEFQKILLDNPKETVEQF